MLSVEEILTDGRRRVLDAREFPTDDVVGPLGGRSASCGRVLVAAGRLRGRGSRSAATAPRPSADDLLALAVAVGVVS